MPVGGYLAAADGWAATVLPAGAGLAAFVLRPPAGSGLAVAE